MFLIDASIFIVKKVMAAKTKSQSVTLFNRKAKKKRKGVNAKTKTSKNKKSKLYKKPNIGQGR